MKWISALFVTLFFCLFGHQSYAQITVNGVDENGISAEDTIDDVKIIYGGIANGLEGANTGTTFNNTCDFSSTTSFSGAPPCNYKNLGDDVNLVISFSYAAAKSGSSFKAKFSDVDFTGGTFLPSAPTPSTTGTATYTVRWGALCQAKFSSALCSAGATAKSFTANLVIRITDGTTDASAEGYSFTYQIKFRKAATTTSVITANCPNGEGEPTGAICDYEVYPGDGKVYFKKLADKNNSLLFGTTCAPSNPVDGEKWYGIRVYTKKYVNTIDVNPSNYDKVEDLTFPINYDCTDFNPGDDFALEGLENGVEYQFAIATLDPTGTVEGYFTTTMLSGTLGSKVRATPAPVEGLLENKCFIATAAFGSSMAPQVQVLRNFRDEWLLKSEAGKFFVKNYYKYSPQIADWIAERPFVKSVVRGMLWPLILFAQLLLEFGWMFLISLAVMGGALLFFFKLRRQVV